MAHLIKLNLKSWEEDILSSFFDIDMAIREANRKARKAPKHIRFSVILNSDIIYEIMGSK